ncbi:MAG: hypothetical protein RL490_1040 [Pseudomonadota bacterium]|jgi:opacity protein-like surface antigen
MRKLLLAATAAAAIAAPAAAATTYNFSVAGGYSWSMPASPTPNGYSASDATFFNVPFTAGPDNFVYILRIYNAAGGGGVAILSDPYGFANSTRYRGLGAEIYTGTLAAPTFKTGTFTLTQQYFGYQQVLTITDAAAGAVPEPASWAMLIAGFGLTGAAMRRRRTSALAA